LQGGETVVWKTCVKYNKYWDHQDSDTGNLFFAGWSHGILLQAHGVPTMDYTNSSNANFGQIVFSANVVQRTRYRPAVSLLRNHIDMINNDNQFSSEEFVDEVAGQVFKAGSGFQAGQVLTV